MKTILIMLNNRESLCIVKVKVNKVIYQIKAFK